MSSDLHSVRRDDRTAHFEDDHDVVSYMERPDLSDSGPSLQESEIGARGFRTHLAAVHGAVVLGREAEVGDLLRAFLTESTVRLPEVDPLLLDTYFVSNLHRINKTPRRIRFYQALNWQNALCAAWLPSGDIGFITVFIAQIQHLSAQEGPDLLIIPREDDLIHARPLLVDVMAHVTVRCGVWVERDAKVSDIFLGTEFDPFCNHHCQLSCWNGKDVVTYDWEETVEARAGAHCRLSRAISCADVSRKRKAISLGTTLLQNGTHMSTEVLSFFQLDLTIHNLFLEQFNAIFETHRFLRYIRHGRNSNERRLLSRQVSVIERNHAYWRIFTRRVATITSCNAQANFRTEVHFLLQRRHRNVYLHVHIPNDSQQPQTAGLVWDTTWDQEQLVPWVRLHVAESFRLSDTAKLWWVEPQPAPYQQHGLDDVHMILFTPVEGHVAVLVCVDWSHIEPNKFTLIAGNFALPVTRKSVVGWLSLEEECRRLTCKFSLGDIQTDDEILPITTDGNRLDLVLQDDACDHLSFVHGRRIQAPEIGETEDETGLMQAATDLGVRDLSADLDTILRVLRKSYHTLQPGQTFTVQIVSGDGFVIRDVLARCELKFISDERKFRQWLEPLLSPSLRGPIRGFLGRVKLVQEAPLLIVARQGQPRQIPYLVTYRPEGLSTLTQIVLVTKVKQVTEFVADFDSQSYLAWSGEDCTYEVDGRWVESSFQVNWIPATVIKIFQSRQRIQELDCGPHMELNAYDPYIQAEEAARRIVPDSSSQYESNSSSSEDTSCLQLLPRQRVEYAEGENTAIPRYARPRCPENKSSGTRQSALGKQASGASCAQSVSGWRENYGENTATPNLVARNQGSYSTPALDNVTHQTRVQSLQFGILFGENTATPESHSQETEDDEHSVLMQTIRNPDPLQTYLAQIALERGVSFDIWFHSKAFPLDFGNEKYSLEFRLGQSVELRIKKHLGIRERISVYPVWPHLNEFVPTATFLVTDSSNDPQVLILAEVQGIARRERGTLLLHVQQGNVGVNDVFRQLHPQNECGWTATCSVMIGSTQFTWEQVFPARQGVYLRLLEIGQEHSCSSTEPYSNGTDISRTDASHEWQSTFDEGDSVMMHQTSLRNCTETDNTNDYPLPMIPVHEGQWVEVGPVMRFEQMDFVDDVFLDTLHEQTDEDKVFPSYGLHHRHIGTRDVRTRRGELIPYKVREVWPEFDRFDIAIFQVKPPPRGQPALLIVADLTYIPFEEAVPVVRCTDSDASISCVAAFHPQRGNMFHHAQQAGLIQDCLEDRCLCWVGTELSTETLQPTFSEGTLIRIVVSALHEDFASFMQASDTQLPEISSLPTTLETKSAEISSLSGGPPLIPGYMRHDLTSREAFDNVRRYLLEYWQTRPRHATETALLVHSLINFDDSTRSVTEYCTMETLSSAEYFQQWCRYICKEVHMWCAGIVAALAQPYNNVPTILIVEDLQGTVAPTIVQAVSWDEPVFLTYLQTQTVRMMEIWIWARDRLLIEHDIEIELNGRLVRYDEEVQPFAGNFIRITILPEGWREHVGAPTTDSGSLYLGGFDANELHFTGLWQAQL